MTQISSNDGIHKVLQTELGTLMSEYIQNPIHAYYKV